MYAIAVRISFFPRLLYLWSWNFILTFKGNGKNCAKWVRDDLGFKKKTVSNHIKIQNRFQKCMPLPLEFPFFLDFFIFGLEILFQRGNGKNCAKWVRDDSWDLALEKGLCQDMLSWKIIFWNAGFYYLNFLFLLHFFNFCLWISYQHLNSKCNDQYCA